MTTPVDYTSAPPEALVRLLIADVDPDRQVVTDDQVRGFLHLNGDNIRRAAAEALDAIGTSELLVGKVIRTQDLQTDAAKLSAELRARADRLRSFADAEEGAQVGGSFFDIIEHPPWSRAELTEG